jgi:hypothetical protein
MDASLSNTRTYSLHTHIRVVKYFKMYHGIKLKYVVVDEEVTA